MDDDKYPSWRDALFGDNNAVANIRCAIHYVFWHAVYALIAVGGLLVSGIILAAEAVAPYLGPLGKPLVRAVSYVGGKIMYVLNHRYTQRLFDWIVMGLAAAVVGVGLVGLVVAIINDPLLVAQFVAAIIGGLIAMIGILFLSSYIEDPARDAATGAASKARSAGEKATKTPGIRRVYGECPVDIQNQAPKWFDDLFDDEEEF